MSPPPPPAKPTPQTKNRTYLWRIAAPFAAAAVLLSIGFLKKDAEFEASLKVEAVSFVTGPWHEPSLLMPDDEVKLRVRGFESVRFVNGAVSAETKAPSDAPHTIDLMRSTHRLAAFRATPARLQRLPATPGSRVSVEWTALDSRRLSVTIDQNGAGTLPPVVIRVTDATQLACSPCDVIDPAGLVPSNATYRARPNSSVAAEITPDRGSITVDFSPSDLTKPGDTNIPVADDSEIAFYRFDDDRRLPVMIGAESVVRFLGNKKNLVLHEGDFLRIADARGVTIQRIDVDRGIRLLIRGRAGRLDHGSDWNTLEDGRPSILEWVASQEELSTYFAGVLMVGTAVLSILTRLKFVPKGE